MKPILARRTYTATDEARARTFEVGWPTPAIGAPIPPIGTPDLAGRHA